MDDSARQGFEDGKAVMEAVVNKCPLGLFEKPTPAALKREAIITAGLALVVLILCLGCAIYWHKKGAATSE